MDLQQWALGLIAVPLKNIRCSRGMNNQGNRRTPVGNSQPLSSATPGITLWAHEWSSCGSGHGGYARAHQQGLPLAKANLAAANARCLACQQQRQTLNPGHGTIPQGAQPATGQHVGYNVPHSIWGKEQYLLIGNNILDVDLPSLSKCLGQHHYPRT